MKIQSRKARAPSFLHTVAVTTIAADVAVVRPRLTLADAWDEDIDKRRQARRAPAWFKRYRALFRRRRPAQARPGARRLAPKHLRGHCGGRLAQIQGAIALGGVKSRSVHQPRPRPNIRVTRGHLDQASGKRVVMSNSKRP